MSEPRFSPSTTRLASFRPRRRETRRQREDDVRKDRAMPECPAEAQVRQFLASSLPDLEAATLAEHLDGCPACLDVLERLSRPNLNPFLLDDLAQARPLEVPGFTVVRQLGRGGMGVVYLADQHAPKRR